MNSATALQHPIESRPATRAHRILIVEDDLELMTVVDHVVKLIDPQMKRDWVSSVEHAITLLREKARKEHDRPYDLILVDIFLEGRSTGLDLWKLCQAHFPDIPIVITSALPIDKFFKEIGPDAISPPFLAKPFKVGECKQLLEGVLKYSEEE